MTDSEKLPACPECKEDYTYENGSLLVCPMCGHEWSPADESTLLGEDEIKDSVGNVLVDGDTVTVVKDLKFKGGGGGTIKSGTKVKGIRLNPNGPDGHDIDATIPGFGKMQLKSSVVKKVS